MKALLVALAAYLKVMAAATAIKELAALLRANFNKRTDATLDAIAASLASSADHLTPDAAGKRRLGKAATALATALVEVMKGFV